MQIFKLVLQIDFSGKTWKSVKRFLWLKKRLVQILWLIVQIRDNRVLRDSQQTSFLCYNDHIFIVWLFSFCFNVFCFPLKYLLINSIIFRFLFLSIELSASFSWWFFCISLFQSTLTGKLVISPRDSATPQPNGQIRLFFNTLL